MVIVEVLYKDSSRRNYRVSTLEDAYAMVERYRYDDSGELRYVAVINRFRGGYEEVECVMPFEYGVARAPICIDSTVWYAVKSINNKKRMECTVIDIDLLAGLVEIRAVRGRRANKLRRVSYNEIITWDEM